MSRSKRRHEHQRERRHFETALGVLRERIERVLTAGDGADEARASAYRARNLFRLPVDDEDLERVLWEAVMRVRPDLMPEDPEDEGAGHES